MKYLLLILILKTLTFAVKNKDEYKNYFVTKDDNKKYILTSSSDFAIKFNNIGDVLVAIKILILDKT